VIVRRGKILVIRGGAIGDFILTLPAITALRNQFPAAHLEILGYPHIAQLALAGGLVDRVQAIEARGLAGFFARDGEISEDLRDYFSEFDLIISYLYDPDEIFQTNVRRCATGQFIAGPHRPDEQERTHATQVFLKPLERLAIFEADTVPRLTVGQASSLSPISKPASRDRLEASPTLALHPGSGSERKNWPEAKWAALLAKLFESTDLRLLLVGGEAEGERLQHLAAPLLPSRREVVQNLPLGELAARLQPCVGFVGHDSGISHLAAALNLPTLVLWADSVEEIWRPQGERVTVVKEISGLHTLGVERVLLELAQLVSLRL
jgi:heptosyltransferase-2